MSDDLKYWIFGPEIKVHKGKYVQAKLLDPDPDALLEKYKKDNYRSPLQHEPYGFNLEFTYQVNREHPHPDFYVESVGFNLFSSRLVDLLHGFGVSSEIFDVKMVDQKGETIEDLEYKVFHFLDKVIEALDKQKSGLKEDWREGVENLVFDYSKLNGEPVFTLDHIYTPMIREDIKEEIQKNKLTGFRFIKPEWYAENKNNFGQKYET